MGAAAGTKKTSLPDFRFWHQADMSNTRTMSAFGAKADMPRVALNYQSEFRKGQPYSGLSLRASVTTKASAALPRVDGI